MASIDERIKQELEQQSDAIDDMLKDEAPIFRMAFAVFKGSMRRTMMFVACLMATFASCLVWSIVEFVHATEVVDLINWGVWAVLSALGAVVVELWAWMQINRLSTRREIKLLEISLRQVIENK